MEFTASMRYAQALHTAKLLSGGLVKVLDEQGALLFETKLGQAKDVASKGERIVFPPLPEATVLRRGDVAKVEIYDEKGDQLLARALAGCHLGAFLKFEDARLFERMIVELEGDVVIEMVAPGYRASISGTRVTDQDLRDFLDMVEVL